MANGTCSIDGCENPHYCRGWCIMHYQRWRLHSDPLWRPPTTADRFWAKVDKLGPDGFHSQTGANLGPCWLWTSTPHRSGYGHLSVGGRKGRHVPAHRFSYELQVGPIPPGLDLDHLCHNRDKNCKGGSACMHRRCVNPDHLEPVPHRENVLRGKGHTAKNAAKTHCLHGHEYTPENTRLYRGRRQCRACDAGRHRATRAIGVS